MMKFGYENEYFLQRADGTIIRVPNNPWPQDAAGYLVEVRSDPHENPFHVLESFKQKYDELVKLVATANLKLSCMAEWKPFNETAGFHIHFSTPEWDGLRSRTSYTDQSAAPADIASIIQRLDKRFEKYWTGVKRHPHWWRTQPHGWEYRRLPATVDPLIITQVLAEEFWTPKLAKVA